MAAIFFFKVPDDQWQDADISRLASGLIHQGDFRDYLIENKGKELKVELSARTNKSDKHSMFDYYHKVILEVAMKVFTDEGWESMDKVKADHFLKNECAKGLVYNPKMNAEVIYLEEKSKMTKERLHKYISDCIMFLEIEKGVRVPDAESYKIEKQTGLSGFTKIK